MQIELKQKKYDVTSQKGNTRFFQIKLLGANKILIVGPKKLEAAEISALIQKNAAKIINLAEKYQSPLKAGETAILGRLYARLSLPELNRVLREAYQKIAALFSYYQALFQRPRTVLIFKKMRSRWGSCQIYKDQITLSTNVAYLPLPLVSYIIVHEFAHFTCPNHSQAFYKIVAKFYPDYRAARRNLRRFLYVMK